MIIYIDISVFSEDGASGNVFGDLEVPLAPQIGDEITFVHGNNLPVNLNWSLKVTARMIVANATDNHKVQVSLADVMVPTRGKVLKVMDFLNQNLIYLQTCIINENTAVDAERLMKKVK